MRVFPGLLLGCALPLLAQQSTPKEGVTMPFPVIPALPASTVVDPDKVVLQVGEVKITAKQLDALVEVYPQNTQVFARGPGKDQFADSVVRMIVLSEEARKRKLNESDKFKDQLRFSEANLLANTLNELLPTQVTVDDATLRKYFEDHACEYQTWKARHLLVRAKGSPMPVRSGEKDLTDEEALARAQDLRKRIAGGADFAETAKTDSDDTNSGANGGDLGQLHHGQTVPTLEEALCKLNPGDLSQPIKTPFGYHLVKLESKEAKDFAELKPTLEQKYRADMAKKAIDEMIAKTKVVKDKEYYAPLEIKDLKDFETKKP